MLIINGVSTTSGTILQQQLCLAQSISGSIHLRVARFVPLTLRTFSRLLHGRTASQINSLMRSAGFANLRGVPRRNKHLLHELAGLPWWISLVVAALVFVAIRWLLPAFGGSNQFLRPLSLALRDRAWWF
jgi:hypothetical protein